jgi:hypothetical protein
VRGVRSSCVTAETNTCRRSLSSTTPRRRAATARAARNANAHAPARDRRRGKGRYSRGRDTGPVTRRTGSVARRRSSSGRAPAATGSSRRVRQQVLDGGQEVRAEARPVEPAPLHVDRVAHAHAARQTSASPTHSAAGAPRAAPRAGAGGRDHGASGWTELAKLCWRAWYSWTFFIFCTDARIVRGHDDVGGGAVAGGGVARRDRRRGGPRAASSGVRVPLRRSDSPPGAIWK